MVSTTFVVFLFRRQQHSTTIGGNDKDPVHIHDFQATVLHMLGLDHEKLIFKHLGRRFRLTDVSGNVVKDLIA